MEVRRVTLSLDANVLIDIINATGTSVRDRFKQARLGERPLAACAIAAHEVMFGAGNSSRPKIQMDSALVLLSSLSVADFTLEDAARAADLRARLRRQGQPIGGFDMLIAGQALNRGWTVVTANTREFGRIEGLDVQDWSLPAP